MGRGQSECSSDRPRPTTEKTPNSKSEVFLLICGVRYRGVTVLKKSSTWLLAASRANPYFS